MNELHHYPKRGFFTARTLAYSLNYMNKYGRKILVNGNRVIGWHVVDDAVELIVYNDNDDTREATAYSRGFIAGLDAANGLS